ncbi:Neuroligin-4, Y-linked [Holothuria leucospilota]|uniref:Neuroligin-4, Y-linked n=1 Tax=Holothuria leucospilota TaxID=206669 RepID=A0A9Q1GXN2_HOLLE|nr:Neuroligin-4, Y-linked [Holothuria leucospilota]
MPPVKRSTRWQETLDARKPGPICPQIVTKGSVIEEDEFTQFSSKVTMLPPAEGMTEDCLTLDIIVPMGIKQIRTLEELDPSPVLVWFHGGDFLRGSSQDQDGSILAAKSGIIIVKVNYRLGIFGFLSMGVQTLVPGNAGLLDQKLALEWIQENIREFGGDPGRVTIFGDDAGSKSVALHLFINDSQPLFHRAIIQNDINFPWNLPDSSAQTVRDLSVKVGCGQSQDNFNPANAVECLQSISIDELLSAAEAITNASWSPVRDDILFKVGETEYVIGSHDVMLGITSWSDVNTISTFIQRDSPSSGVSEEEFNDVISGIVASFNPVNQSELIASSIRQSYNNWEDPHNEILRALSLMRLLNDWDVLNPAFEFLRLWVPQEGDANVFVFVFDDSSNVNSTAQAPVSSLSEFIWGQPFQESEMSSFSRNLSQNVIYYWKYFNEKG